MYGSKPAFGAVRTHANYSTVKPASPMSVHAASPMSTQAGFGPSSYFGLRGPVTSVTQEHLLGEVNDLFAQIDEINALLDQAARSDVVSPDQQASWLSRMDEIASGAQRLSTRVGTLDDSAIEDWRTELTRLSNLADVLHSEVSSTSAAATGSKVLTVAAWTGLGVFGAIGTLLLVRWWSKKPHRKGRRR